MTDESLAMTDKHSEHEQNSAEPFDYWSRKNVKGYWGEVWTDGDRIRFAILKNLPAEPGDDLLTAAGRTTKEMHNRLEQAVGHKVY